jgi:hypothetical protein
VPIADRFLINLPRFTPTVASRRTVSPLALSKWSNADIIVYF